MLKVLIFFIDISDPRLWIPLWRLHIMIQRKGCGKLKALGSIGFQFKHAHLSSTDTLHMFYYCHCGWNKWPSKDSMMIVPEGEYTATCRCFDGEDRDCEALVAKGSRGEHPVWVQRGTSEFWWTYCKHAVNHWLIKAKSSLENIVFPFWVRYNMIDICNC